MGQIVSSAAKPKRCNANQLSQVPTPAAGEHILVSSDNSMNAAGQGNFDCYIVGDGTTAATALELKNVETLIGVFDISSYHATGGVLAKYADLTAALNDGNNIPQSLRKGGMSVKFVQSSDNKYVQYFLAKDEWSTLVYDWEKINLSSELYGNKKPVSPWTNGKTYYTNKGVGNAYDTVLHGDNSARCIIVPANAGEQFVVNGRGGSSSRLWCFADVNNIILSVSDVNVSSSNDALIITAPNNATQLIINNLSGYTEDCYKIARGDVEKINAELADHETRIGVLEGKASVAETNDEKTLNVLTANAGNVQTTYSEGYINSTGGVSSSSFAVHSDFVAIQSGVRYSVFSTSSDNWNIAYYSAANEGSFISAQPLGPTTSTYKKVAIQIPENAVYVRITRNKSTDSKFEYISESFVSTPLKDVVAEMGVLATKTATIDGCRELLSEKETTIVQTTYSNGYINSSGTVSTSNYAKHSDFVAIQESAKYVLYSRAADNWRIAYYSGASESSFISAQALGATTTDPITINLIIPLGATHLRVTKDVTSVSNLSVVTETLMETSVPESLKDLQDQITAIGGEKVYVVNPNGGADYTGLVQALADLHDDETKKKILVMGGEYDIFEEMGGQAYLDTIPADVNNSLWYLYSNFVPNNTSIIGIGEVTLNFNPPSTTPNAKMGVIGPIALRGNVHIENVTINASNCRYCIHDETGSTAENYKKTYKNVKLFKSGGGFTQAYGAGHSANNTIIFDNCLFSSTAGPIWSVHDNRSADNTTIVLNNCAIIVPSSESTALRFGTLNATSGTKVVQINNCSLGGGKVYFDDSADMPNRYKLTLIKSGNPTFVDDSGANPFVPTVIE